MPKMENKINIANILLTRRCNLACEYCRIATTKFDNYLFKPKEYPDAKYYIQNEAPTEKWIEFFDRLYKHNPDCFTILYGGEPFIVWEKLADIVNYLNKINGAYTIISSCNHEIKKLIYKFFDKVGRVKGFTASVDPYLHKYIASSVNKIDRNALNDDELYKTFTGYSTLLELMRDGLVKDPVAEITCDCNTIFDLEETVKILSYNGICSDITVVDVSKNNYYDFSNIIDKRYLVHPTKEVIEVFESLQASDYNIHMKEFLMEKLPGILPSNVDCELEKGMHNITIEPDLGLRLCLRIRGVYSTNHNGLQLFNEEGEFGEAFEEIHAAMKADKESLCKGCSWSCVLMSKNGDCGKIINH